ncbi:XRE family transcriptional regulator [Companilactobacillus suantsaicola]|uniref:XRE family transcriptional regulator n=1 Tax=Companilactobacillus suantsaicola TaxID=2487723 RepID=A0A4Z0JLN6_9LACO|nr:helix-turn-helix transcriptional regulator [Companilactobacillus suantsaicola]TGD23991.1 XRE family transcriptional regulator [Companilactobacillus suantsaicola]
MYNNQYLKAYFTLKNIKQNDIAKLLDKSTSTIRRKNDDLGFTQKEILLIHNKYNIPIEAFFYDKDADDKDSTTFLEKD